PLGAHELAHHHIRAEAAAQAAKRRFAHPCLRREIQRYVPAFEQCPEIFVHTSNLTPPTRSINRSDPGRRNRRASSHPLLTQVRPPHIFRRFMQQNGTAMEADVELREFFDKDAISLDLKGETKDEILK